MFQIAKPSVTLTIGRRSFKLVDKLLCFLHVAVRIEDFIETWITLFLIQELHELIRRQIRSLLSASVVSQHTDITSRICNAA